MEKKIRRYRNNLITSGMAVVVFTVWDVVKLAAGCLTNSTYREYYQNTIHYDDKLLLYIEIIVIIFFIGIFAAIQAIMGFSAIRIGKGARQRNGYLVLCVIMILLTIGSLYLSVTDQTGMSFDIVLAGCIMDFTLLLALIDLFVSSIMVRKLEKKLSREGA